MGNAVVKAMTASGLSLFRATEQTKSSFISVPPDPERRSRFAGRFCVTFGDPKVVGKR
ncbi:hypothetical protein LQ318_08775 [Aliifodinibius salicampi]|uniref:Uncharacterized protein n=1 Tax=Fodinibius salicampi TaxID=1920655 RepID=A0ABT3PYT0_9BACT|nr:hypothetical protein [Fodinibius salicampi]MCW9712998.1 hypothetical protein [Fodinibius salicampi]